MSEAAVERKLFISYGHPEADICREICGFLTANGYNVWFDESHISHGANWREKIAQGIHESQGVLAMLSRHSVRNPGVCLDELSIAIGVRGGNIVTILLEPEKTVNPPPSLTNNQWLDMSRWLEMRENDPALYERWFAQRMAELLSVLESPESRNFAGDIDFIRGKLPLAVHTRSKQTALLGKPFVGRQWLAKQVDEYLDSPDSGRMCILYGDPGIGKSAFAAHYTHYNHRVAAAIFCEHGYTRFNDPAAVIQTLAFLLACRLPDYRVALRNFLENSGAVNCSDPDLFDRLLTDILATRSVDGKREPLAVIIDGLDECGDAEQNLMAEMLVRFADRLPGWLKILALSRRVQGVKAPAAGGDSIELRGDDANNIADVRAYFASELETQLAESGERETILDGLSERSGGIYLYAAMIVDGVRKGKMDLKRRSEYPQGLSGVFNDWFGWFFPDRTEYKNSFLRALSMLIASSAPLPEEELVRTLNWRKRALHEFTDRVEVLLTRSEDAFGKPALSLSHRYISEWLSGPDAGIYRADPEDGIADMAEAFYAILEDDPEDLTGYEALYLLPFLKDAGMRREYRKACVSRELAEVLKRYGNYCRDWGKHATALALYRAAMEIVKARAEEDDSYDNLQDLSVSCNSVGDILNMQGDTAGALELYRQSMDIGRRLVEERGLPNDLRDLSVSCERVSDILQAQGDTEGAFELYRQSMDISRKLAKERGLPEDLRDLSISCNKVGGVLEKRGEIEGALELYQQGMEMRRRLVEKRGLPDDLSDLASSCIGVGSILEAQGNPIGAIKMYNQSRDICKKLVKERGLPRDLSSLASSCIGIGDIMKVLGDTEGAIEFYRQGMDIIRKLVEERGLPQDLCNFSVSCDRVGDMLKAQGDTKGALELYRQSMDICRKLVEEQGLPDNLRSLSISCHRVGGILEAQRDTEGALVLYRQAVDIGRKLVEERGLPDDQQALLVSCFRVGSILKVKGDTEGTLELYRQCIDISRKLAEKRGLPRDLGDFSTSCDKVAAILKAQGDTEGALDLYRQSLETRKKLLGIRKTPQLLQDMVITYLTIGVMHKSREEIREAFEMFSAAMVIVRQFTGDRIGRFTRVEVEKSLRTMLLELLQHPSFSENGGK